MKRSALIIPILTGASTAPVKIGMIRAERFMGILLEGCGTAIGADQ
ncbi:hypothetical protein FB41_2422 [Cutibacterium acnes]|nr:hypothetical protein FB41_2422 [Cutibacterium acnes]